MDGDADFDLEVEVRGSDRFCRCVLRAARGGGSLLWSVSGGRDLNQALSRCLADLERDLRFAARGFSLAPLPAPA